jgi:lipid II:glycine glycyltransferase (peptidoglycan interpeptide bridge formation enzyme)
MSFKFINKQEKWNSLILKQGGNFMQSWEWGSFRKKNNIQPLRIEIQKNAFQVEKRPLALGKYYFYIAGQDPKNLRSLVRCLKEKAMQENAIFLKIESLKEKEESKQKTFLKNNFKKTKRIQPKKTLILDISKDKDVLFEGFHKKHRYNIRLAQRKGIKIKIIYKQQEFENFYSLIKKTDQRKSIKDFPKKYHKELFDLSKENDKNQLKVIFLGAYLKKQIIAGLTLLIWHHQATYLIGASDYNYRKYMAPHLLQWQAIQLAQQYNCKQYDFWGIIEKKDFDNEADFKKHPWAGITRFKEGFSGTIVSYEDAYIYVFSPFWHKIYQLAKIFKD